MKEKYISTKENKLSSVLDILNSYILKNYNEDCHDIIKKELKSIIGYEFNLESTEKNKHTYEQIQEMLLNLNEKEKIRKAKGVYYTPTDIVDFILINSIKLSHESLSKKNISDLNLKKISYRTFCFEKKVFDPTSGTGAFLLRTLELKLNTYHIHIDEMKKEDLRLIVNTINGNDVNTESTTICKIRMLLCLLHRYSAEMIEGISNILNRCFKNYDYTVENDFFDKYDIIIGNPPYVEITKNKSLEKKIPYYGNIYANVLDNVLKHLKKDGVMGFIIPLSYISTPRMKKIRDNLYNKLSQQYILSYSDRPDCLFGGVHQKLCILLGTTKDREKVIKTSNYRYWYREERERLFKDIDLVINKNLNSDFFPKLGTALDIKIYKKILDNQISLAEGLDKKNIPLYLNMRATFWIKAFFNKQKSSEYREFTCENQAHANLFYCLLNSSLFWWFWICISDCWHITKKELNNFKIPNNLNFQRSNILAKELSEELEKSKVYIGSKQTEYEYKHKNCINTIHKIDDFICEMYGLTEEECEYIKNYAYQYRTGGGKK